MPIIASNFKTNHTRKSTILFVSEINNLLEKNKIYNKIYIFPTSTSLDHFETIPNLIIGVQSAYPTINGLFTGEIGTFQLNEFEIKTILIGHSKKRHILGGAQETITKKYGFYKNLGYKIIYYTGEPLEIKKRGIGKTPEYIYEQFIGIDVNYSDLIPAYEPVWVIGTGVTATIDDIKNVHNAIKQKINKPLLYGGSVKVGNIREICQIGGIDSILIGTASWKVEDFIEILEDTRDL